MATDFQRLIETLVDGQVEFVVVGGVAVIAHGHTRLTEDLDICYRRSDANHARLCAAVAPLRPTLRGAPKDLPFVFDVRTVRSGLNFTLETEAGDLDLLGEVTGVGGYEQMIGDSLPLQLYGRRVPVISLTLLERAKRAAGRAKDLPDLEAIRAIKRGRV